MKHHWLYLLIVLLIVFGTNQLNAQEDEQDKIDQVKQDFREIGLAIEALFKDTGLMLVDLDDGTTAQGIKRIREDFDGVGLPQNGVRSLQDVLQPLVHFGYLDEIPTDPFIPENAPPEWDAYLYIDHEVGLNGFYDVPFLEERFHENSEDNEWWLVSPGPDQEFHNGLLGRDIYDYTLRRFHLYMEPPLSEELLVRQQEIFQKLGKAIAQFQQEQGVMLIDKWDDEHEEIFYNRTNQHFYGIGIAPYDRFPDLNLRTFHEVYAPLIALGYIDEIPVDPVLMPYPRPSQDRYNEGFITYRDNDPEIEGQDYGGALLDNPLEEGEWVLGGYKPDINETPEPDRIVSDFISQEITNAFFPEDLDANLEDWQLH